MLYDLIMIHTKHSGWSDGHSTFVEENRIKAANFLDKISLVVKA